MLSYFVKTILFFSNGKTTPYPIEQWHIPTSTTIKKWRCQKRSEGHKEERRMNYKLSLYGRSLFPPSLSLLSSLILSSLSLHWNIIPYCNYFLKVSTLKTCVYFTYTFNFCDFTFSLLSTKFNWCVNVVIEIQCLIRSRLPRTTTTYHPH